YKTLNFKMNKILYVGYIEFPYGLAQVQRQLTISKVLTSAGYDVKVLCRYGCYSPKESDFEYLNKGVFEGIKYEFCSGTPYRSKNFIRRNFNKLKGAFKELNYIVRLGRKKELKAVFITTNYFYNILFYWIACKIGRVQSILDNVEYFSKSKQNKSKFERIGAYFYDYYLFYFIDKIICISDFLVSKAEFKMTKNKILKIPAITEFKKFEIVPIVKYEESYILYCGSISYFEIIEFVISAFEKSQKSKFLYLISNSNDLLKKRINESSKKNNIRVFSNISFEKLISLYKQCTAFIIPMRPNINDLARFPHKISEFCASGKPFISNSYGEVKVYFEDNVNALLCDEYSIEKFSNKMDGVFENTEKIKSIGRNAFELGERHFSHLAYVDEIKKFINLKH
ncbi:glycosyltransferase, partial [bacterium]|nr:glycosyltransferase [bacterium]